MGVVHTTVMIIHREPHFEFADFAPGEVARITGVSTTLLRDWRRRGLIREGLDKDANGVFDLEAVLELLTLRLLSEMGVGPKTMLRKTLRINDALFSFAVDDPAAWPTPTDHLRWMAKPRNRADHCGYAYIDRAGQVTLAEDPAEAFKDAGSMVVTVLDLRAIARHVREAAGKPLGKAGYIEIAIS